MNIEDVAGQLALALATVPGLRVAPWGVEAVQPPMAIIDAPERIEYDQTYGRGVDRFTDWQIVVLMPRTNDRTALAQLAKYAAGAGSSSVKARLEAYTYTACDPSGVHVVWAEFDTAKYAGADYLALIFHLNITGKGAP